MLDRLSVNAKKVSDGGPGLHPMKEMGDDINHADTESA
jgi:hypothetical protein